MKESRVNTNVSYVTFKLIQDYISIIICSEITNKNSLSKSVFCRCSYLNRFLRFDDFNIKLFWAWSNILHLISVSALVAVLNLFVHMVIAVNNSMIVILYKITFLYTRMIWSDICSVPGEASRISEVKQLVIITYMPDLKIIPVKFVGKNLPCTI